MIRKVILLIIIVSVFWGASYKTYSEGKNSQVSSKGIDKDCEEVVFNLLIAVRRGDYQKLLECLDCESQMALQQEMEDNFHNNPKELMNFLKICIHPGRYDIGVHLTREKWIDNCMYYKIDLTWDYKVALDEIRKPIFENKPVINWICFKYQKGKYVMHLDFPLHDIIYFLQ